MALQGIKVAMFQGVIVGLLILFMNAGTTASGSPDNAARRLR